MLQEGESGNAFYIVKSGQCVSLFLSEVLSMNGHSSCCARFVAASSALKLRQASLNAVRRLFEFEICCLRVCVFVKVSSPLRGEVVQGESGNSAGGRQIALRADTAENLLGRLPPLRATGAALKGHDSPSSATPCAWTRHR